MSGFAFGFSGEDIDHEEDQEFPDVVTPLEASGGEDPIPAKHHSLEGLLGSLPSHISYGHVLISTPQGQLQLPRRELFDVRTQLMAEDAAENDDLLSGLDKGDLSSGIYEGGFKTWECSIDLAQVILDIHGSLFSPHQNASRLNCIELGAGTAVASMAVLASYLSSPESERPSSLHLTVCDYNEAVLRLVTLPNLLLVWHGIYGVSQEAGEFDVDGQIIQQFKDDLQRLKVTIDFVSGAWSATLVDLALNTDQSPSSGTRLILASETIYSPTSTGVFTETLSKLIQGAEKATALVAAKKIYFGVGGGVDDFCLHLDRYNLQYQTALDVANAGVGRVVLRVEEYN